MGEIEVVLRLQNVQEKTARLRCLLVLLYYSQYLDIKDLRDQYDVLLKQVEREEAHGGRRCGTSLNEPWTAESGLKINLSTSQPSVI